MTLSSRARTLFLYSPSSYCGLFQAMRPNWSHRMPGTTDSQWPDELYRLDRLETDSMPIFFIHSDLRTLDITDSLLNTRDRRLISLFADIETGGKSRRGSGGLLAFRVGPDGFVGVYNQNMVIKIDIIERDFLPSSTRPAWMCPR